MRLLHGTSELEWSAIQWSGGLRSPYLTKLETVAWYFAETSAENVKSTPVILEIEVPDQDRLEADLPMFEEPIMEVFEEIGYVSSYTYHQAVEAGDIPWPRDINDWKTSLEVVKSVRYRGAIPLDRIRVYERGQK